MEAVLTRLKGLTADELREEFARADLKCVAITATTRSIFEKKLARMLAGPESGTTETENGSSARDADGVTSVPDHDKPLPCPISSVAASSGPNDELDFGYGVGLNPPEEEEICDSQSKMNTPSKIAQVSSAFYYGVCPSWEDILSRNERAHVYTDKKDALQAVKGMKGARFKAFSNREDAENFAKGMSDYIPSPNKCLASISPFKPSQTISKDFIEVDTINRERANSFKSPRTQDLTAKLRKAVEKGDEVAFIEIVWSNPRYLIGSGDNPTIVQEGCRYNVMHVAAKENQAGIAQLLLDTLENPEFMRLMYPDDQEVMLQKRIRYIVDLYLNTPDKAGFETPLHFACKFGCPDVVNVLCSHPDTDKNRKNSNDHKPCDIICSRKNTTTKEVRQKIRDYLEDRCYIPLLRAADNTSQPIIGAPWSPEASESLSLIQRHAKSPLDPLMTVAAFAGPLSPSKAGDFRRSWKTPPRTRAEHFHNILKSDPDRGAERVGRDLAHEMDLPWAEYWAFLDCFIDLSSIEGLQRLEEYLSRKDFFPRTCEEGENETSNRFKTPSPGKPKKFCNSISVGAFLDEGEDISLEEMKNRQNAALTSITSSATSMDNLKGAVGGHDFHIMPMGIKYRGDDLIETAAEQDLLSPGICKNEVCCSSRDEIPNGDNISPRSSPSASSMLSPVSNLLAEFERMSLQDQPDSPDGCRERRSSGNRHRETLDSYSSPIGTDLNCGLKRLSIGHGSHNSEALKGGDTEERCNSGSSEEFLDADTDSLELMSRTRGAASGLRNFCARSKSWDHGGRDLSSSGSSASSFKSLDNSHEFLPRTPPHIRTGLFIHGVLKRRGWLFGPWPMTTRG
ncbi:ankyrin repeat and LEM domain-containing protein 2 isoform X2 [Syngnathoides biaculeatus]|uniref:ankyrin repeat and LEM domain-containing protein 2 isoform X2 n=1 Tax=Syngnathoides biaculeatus TaxID=300417 RepID=UPI002ADDC8FC|nr:ankyrin repeat and LEM domain-containing protein 2 isoform X2 [Syngnathoides biaculeatus]